MPTSITQVGGGNKLMLTSRQAAQLPMRHGVVYPCSPITAQHWPYQPTHACLLAVVELPVDIWEAPAGLGLFPLQFVFTVCSQIHQWLSLASDNVVVRGG